MLGGAQLAQTRPSDTNNTQAYSPATGFIAEITSVFVANTTGSAATFRLYHDNDGTTYSEATALMWDVSVASGASVVVDDPIYLNSASNLAVRSSVGNALTFTVYGIETEGSAQ